MTNLTKKARELLTLLYDEEECISASDKALLGAALDVVDVAASTRKYWSACAWDGGCLPHGPRPRAEAKWCDQCRLRNAIAKFKEKENA